MTIVDYTYFCGPHVTRMVLPGETLHSMGQKMCVPYLKDILIIVSIINYHPRLLIFTNKHFHNCNTDICTYISIVSHYQPHLYHQYPRNSLSKTGPIQTDTIIPSIDIHTYVIKLPVLISCHFTIIDWYL